MCYFPGAQPLRPAMRQTSRILYVIALLAALNLAVWADDKPPEKAPPPKAEPKPVIDEAEVKRAEALLKPVRNDEYAVLCALRYLLCPSFEDEVFGGRWRPGQSSDSNGSFTPPSSAITSCRPTPFSPRPPPRWSGET